MTLQHRHTYDRDIYGKHYVHRCLIVQCFYFLLTLFHCAWIFQHFFFSYLWVRHIFIFITRWSFHCSMWWIFRCEILQCWFILSGGCFTSSCRHKGVTYWFPPLPVFVIGPLWWRKHERHCSAATQLFGSLRWATNMFTRHYWVQGSCARFSGVLEWLIPEVGCGRRWKMNITQTIVTRDYLLLEIICILFHKLYLGFFVIRC